FATCRRLGVATVAVYSDADAGLPFVREADLAVRLPGSTPAQTYLRIDLVIDAARRTGADAVHPGYGFLSERADFARAVQQAGLTWLGPDPESIDSMGSKIEAKKLMSDAGVPVLGQLDPATVTEANLPLLVKASAGGGGRGMRIVRSVGQVAGEVELASAEAASAFGDATVFCEPYVESGRHVEVQIVGDRHGNVLVLGERDCSIQRRHQKVVEEAPAPGLSDEIRAALHDAASKAASAVGYVGAGTVEFLLSRDRFFFLEMNTRLQVEHPVTEAVFGVDLVELQIAVAEDADLGSRAGLVAGAAPGALTPVGHAVEVRLYAEDPAGDWQPQSGRLTRFDVPHDDEFRLASYGIRLDSGFEAGNEVGTFYDAMLAKVICWGPTRAAAFRSLAGALERARLHGLTTNRDLLVELLRDPEVLAGEMTTDLFDRREFDATGPSAEPSQAALFAATIALAEDTRLHRTVQRGIPTGWRNVVSQPQRVTLVDEAGTEHVVEWYGSRDGYSGRFRVLEATRTGVTLEVNGVRSHTDVRIGDVDAAGERAVHLDGAFGSVGLRASPRFVDPADQVSAGSLLAPMPGMVVNVDVHKGDRVEAGRTVLVLEAMKMQHTVTAPAVGIVTEIAVKVGDQVAAGEVLAVVELEVADNENADPAEGVSR
ncbi:MAG: biotin carboxylase N-terminal domain-containing protein, partial [Marmoricola sp.]